ncbi:MAG: (5-formylfuran-3-yl)methyl phosphate synthase [Planctomycetaceae bacterium]
MSEIQLLVSVRNAAEASVALAGGADIIDVKDPDSGPLGFAGSQRIRDVVTIIDRRAPVSAALGECVDWCDQDATAFAGLSFLKLGLAGMTQQTDWIGMWTQVRNRIDDPHSGDRRLSDLPPRAAWVAVAYADADRASAPTAWSVLEAAVESKCAILLVDTFVKDGRGTLHWMNETELRKLRQAAHEHGLSFVLAGQLGERDLPKIQKIRPDVFAVRGAVCEGHERRATICGRKVRTLREHLNGPSQDSTDLIRSGPD